MIKVWTGSVWSWIKVRITGREIPDDARLGSPSLIRRGNGWWLHTPIEKQLKSPSKIEKQITTNEQTKSCSGDVNITEHLAVCTIRTVEGSILTTKFISGGRRVNGLRKKQLGRIARNRGKTGIIAEGEQDNADLWRKITNVDEHIAHLVSAHIVQWASQHEATVLVFEHLGNLKPAKGKYSRRGNSKRAFWMKGRIFKYAKYKAYNAGILTSRVNPRNTSRECARCHGFVARYNTGQPAEDYTMGAPLVACHQCGMRGNADRNASLVIGSRLVARYQKPSKEKPHTPLKAGRVSKDTGVVISQDAKTVGTRPSPGSASHAAHHTPGTANATPARIAHPHTQPPTHPPS